MPTDYASAGPIGVLAIAGVLSAVFCVGCSDAPAATCGAGDLCPEACTQCDSPAAVCLDETTLLTYEVSGCENGDCQFLETQVPCTEGCAADLGACRVCVDQCEAVDELVCEAGQRFHCDASSDGCLVLGAPRVCTSGQCVDANSCAPVDACVHECQTLQTTACDEGAIMACEADADGCRRWSSATGCATQRCHDETRCEEPVPTTSCGPGVASLDGWVDANHLQASVAIGGVAVESGEFYLAHLLESGSGSSSEGDLLAIVGVRGSPACEAPAVCTQVSYPIPSQAFVAVYRFESGAYRLLRRAEAGVVQAVVQVPEPGECGGVFAGNFQGMFSVSEVLVGTFDTPFDAELDERTGTMNGTCSVGGDVCWASSWPSEVTETERNPNSMAVGSNGTLFVGGNFDGDWTSSGGFLLKFDADGVLVSTDLDPFVVETAQYHSRRLADLIRSNGQLYAVNDTGSVGIVNQEGEGETRFSTTAQLDDDWGIDHDARLVANGNSLYVVRVLSPLSGLDGPQITIFSLNATTLDTIATRWEIEAVWPEFLGGDTSGTIYVSTDNEGTILALDPTSETELWRAPRPEGMQAFSVSPDGQTFVTTTAETDTSVTITWRNAAFVAVSEKTFVPNTDVDGINSSWLVDPNSFRNSGYPVTVDNDGNVVVAGESSASAGPTSSYGYGGRGGFIAEFAATGTLSWSDDPPISFNGAYNPVQLVQSHGTHVLSVSNSSGRGRLHLTSYLRL